MGPSEKQPWTPADEATLRELVEEKCNAPTIARRMKRRLNSIRNKMQALGLKVLAERFPVESETVAERWDKMRRRATEEAEHRIAALDWLRPVALPAPTRPKTTGKPGPFTLVAGDFHFGMHDDRALALFLATVEALKPKRVILNGDTVDLLAVSKYPKDHRKGKTWELRDEVAAFHSFLHSLHAIGDAWKIEVVETEANHSGNGTAGRWWRYLNDRCPELLGHNKAEELLSYETWFFPEWSNIKLVNDYMIADELLVIHGDIVRKDAGYTAKASREKWMNSILVNHTHRMGFSPKTITAHAGRPTSYVRAYENGCLCKVEVPYAVALDWQQGFAIVCEESDLFSVEQVIIDNGRANVAALGRTIRV